MSDYQRPGGGIDEDRLPWLEPVDDYDDGETIPLGRLIGAVVVGLVALGLVIGGIFWFRNRDNGGGNGALIEAPAGPVKVRPQEAGGLAVDGTGDIAYGASVGDSFNSVIDASAMPEEPLTETRIPPAPAPGPDAVKPAPKPASKLVEAKPAAPKAVQSAQAQPTQPKPTQPKPAQAKPTAPKSSVTVVIGATPGKVQLGAFSSAALADKAWANLTRRFPALSGASRELSPVTVDGKTLYRLRASVKDPSALCARIKATGEACSLL